MTYHIEYTDTFGGDANYAWVRRATVTMPELEHDTVYTSAATVARKHRAYERELMRRAKRAIGLSGVRGRRADLGDTVEFRPYRSCTVLFISPAE